EPSKRVADRDADRGVDDEAPEDPPAEGVLKDLAAEAEAQRPEDPDHDENDDSRPRELRPESRGGSKRREPRPWTRHPRRSRFRCGGHGQSGGSGTDVTPLRFLQIGGKPFAGDAFGLSWNRTSCSCSSPLGV